MDNAFFVNGRFFGQRITGVQRHAYELTKVLASKGLRFKILTPQNLELPEEFGHLQCAVGKREGTIWEQTDLYSFVQDKGVPLLNFCNTAPIRYHRNWVTIHDLGVFVNSAWFSRKFSAWYKYLMPRIIKKAECILTVSQTIGGDISERFGREADAVLYNGVPSNWAQVEGTIKENVVLMVGTPSSRKRFELVTVLADEFAAAGFRLVVVGERDRNLKASSSNEQEVFKVDDEGLRSWYARSKFVISASDFEGFNLPILEGMYFGCQPLLSDIPVHREIYGDFALYFSNAESLRNIIEKLGEKFADIKHPPETWWKERSYEESGNKLIGLLNKT